MEWLLANEEVEEVVENSENVEQTITTTTTPPPPPESDSTETLVAKSIKCEECGKLFTTQTEVEFHSAKSGW